jgi:hypothetical protein
VEIEKEKEMTPKKCLEKYKWLDAPYNDDFSPSIAITEVYSALRSAQARIEILEEQHGFDHSALQSAQARIGELERAIREVLALRRIGGNCNYLVLNAVLSHKQPPPRSEEIECPVRSSLCKDMPCSQAYEGCIEGRPVRSEEMRAAIIKILDDWTATPVNDDWPSSASIADAILAPIEGLKECLAGFLKGRIKSPPDAGSGAK